MPVMLAGVTAERQYIQSFASFNKIEIRDGDGHFYQHGSRGDVARTIVCNKFLENPKFDALMLCDLDQKFPVDVLEKLRSHDKDMVSAHYMKRTTKTLQSIWQYSLDGSWPYLPYLYGEIPTEGLHRIAQTGMGCVLIKREVIEAVADLFPYGSSPFEIGKIPELTDVAANFGSDYRFFYYAQMLGFELWGDADIDTPHAQTMWLTRNLYDHVKPDPNKQHEYLIKHVYHNSIRSRGVITLNAAEARRQALEKALSTIDDPERRKHVEGQLSEVTMWVNDMKENSPPTQEKKPKMQKIGNLPTFKSRAELEHALANPEQAIGGEDEELAKTKRRQARQRQDLQAAKRLNGRSGLITSTEQGKMDEV